MISIEREIKSLADDFMIDLHDPSLDFAGIVRSIMSYVGEINFDLDSADDYVMIADDMLFKFAGEIIARSGLYSLIESHEILLDFMI
jgi:hypothetical protein